MTRQGKVFLVGAGPGDTGLLTVKALSLIREADLIVYDYLANPEHLRFASPEAVKICVGKRFRHRVMTQEKINRIILTAAKKGKTVVRLKGGDPYLFGRGGEEALFLKKNRVAFEVVPGVTSATACAAYAGIPLTHRDHNASVTFLTGHRAHDAHLDSIDWKKIVGLDGTLVIYMGFYNLAVISRRLMENGMRRDMPVAVIEWGTLPRQRSCEGTLSAIADRVHEQGLKAPCIIIIGDVVSLRKDLNWYEKLPLFGKRVVITRTRDKNSLFRERLERLGPEILELPTIEIQKPSSFRAMDRVIRRIGQFDWAVFTSAYGVQAFFERLAALHKDARALAGVRVACVGPETAAALAEKGIAPDLIPRRFETAALPLELKKNAGSLIGQKLALFRADIAPLALETGLKRLGASVTRVTAYRTRLPKRQSVEIRRALLAGNVDWVTFTSSSTVKHFVALFGLRRVKKMAKRTKFASIGPVTTRTLRGFGLKPACEAKAFTTDGLVAALLEKA